MGIDFHCHCSRRGCGSEYSGKSNTETEASLKGSDFPKIVGLKCPDCHMKKNQGRFSSKTRLKILHYLKCHPEKVLWLPGGPVVVGRESLTRPQGMETVMGLKSVQSHRVSARGR